jgi:hypothetical protein
MAPHYRPSRGASPGRRARTPRLPVGVGLALAAVALVQACTNRSVTGVPVVSVDVSPSTAQLMAGEQVRFSATVRHENGSLVQGAAVTWSSSASSVLSVGSDGMGTALREGSATVSASYQGVTGSAPVVVLSGPVLAVSSTSVALSGAIGGAEPSRGVIEITNLGEGTLSGLTATVDYAAGGAVGWLSPVLSGTTAPATLTLIATMVGLDPGTHSATVTVGSNGGEATVSVQLTVTSDVPTLRLSPSSKTFDFRVGEPAPSPVSVSVTNSGGGDLGTLSTSVWYQAGSGWLSASLAGSTAPTQLTLAVDPSGLGLGSYRAEVRVAAANGVNSPRSLLVTLNVLPEPSYSVSQSGGGTVVSESGTTDRFSVVLGSRPTSNVVLRVTSGDAGEVAAGPSTLTFTPVDWNTPQTVTVTGVDDPVMDGDQVTAVTVSVNDAASDDAFDPLPDQSVLVTTRDNDAAGFTVSESGGSTIVSESGTTDEFTVVLDVQPSSDVVFSVSAPANDEATVGPTSLTFTPSNWAAPQSVTVTGVDDALLDGNQVTPVTISVVDASSDDAFDGLADQVVSVTTTDDEGSASYTVSPTTLSVPEATPGNTRNFSVALGSKPASNVVFTVVSANSAEATVSPASLTYTQGNWSTSQTVTVTAVDDAVADGDQIVVVTVAVDDPSSDDAYDALADQTVTVTTVDNDAVGFTVVESGGGTVVSEAGTVDGFTVVLDAKPASNVVLGVASADLGEVTVSLDSLTFTPGSWSTPQNVTVTGIDDQIQDGNQLTAVTVSVRDGSSDDAFDPLPDTTVSVTTVDNDAVGFSVSGGPITVAESGPDHTGTFDVVLDAEPASDVVFDVSSYDAAVASVSPPNLTFTPVNWSTPQSVTVTGVDDAVVDGAQVTTVTVSVNDGDSDNAFDPLPDEVVNVETLDDEVAGFTVSGGPILVNEQAPGNTGTFQVVLTAQPLSNVVLDMSSDDPSEAAVSPTTLTFTPSNWSTPQAVTVTGVDDPDVDGDALSFVTISVNDAGSANAFDPLPNQTVSVTTADDDTPAGGAGFTVSVPGGSITVNEAAPGNTGSFTVVLATQPTSNVVLNLTGYDAAVATVSPTTLTFTQGNWSAPKSVTVTGTDDALIDGDQVTTITVSVNDASSDDAFDPLPDQTVSVTTTDNDVAGFIVSGGPVVVNEQAPGNTGSFDVVLSAQPSSDVVLDVSSDDPSEASVSPATLTFTPGSWNAAQTVTVTGVDDALVDGNQVTTISVSVNGGSSDDVFDPLPDQTVSVTTTDDDAPAGGAGFTVSGGPIDINEAAPGNSGTFNVVLDSQPASNVVFGVTSADEEVATVSPATLTFTPANWSTPQAVAVTAADNPVADGDHAVVVAVAVDDGASDNAFDPLPDQTVDVTVHDDEVAGFSVDAQSVMVSEAGTSATFHVVLDGRPASTVDILVSSDDPGEATAGPARLRFTPGKWNVPQTVTVTGVDDAEVDGDQDFFVTLTVDDAASPAAFHGLSDQVGVTTTDDDVASFSLNVGSPEAGEGADPALALALGGAPAPEVMLEPSSGALGHGWPTARDTLEALPVDVVGVSAAADNGTLQIALLVPEPELGGPGSRERSVTDS